MSQKNAMSRTLDTKYTSIKEIFGNNKDKNVIINIGGIANITFLNFDNKEVFGYDIGPGNCLMDTWIRITKNLDFDS